MWTIEVFSKILKLQIQEIRLILLISINGFKSFPKKFLKFWKFWRILKNFSQYFINFKVNKIFRVIFFSRLNKILRFFSVILKNFENLNQFSFFCRKYLRILKNLYDF